MKSLLCSITRGGRRRGEDGVEGRVGRDVGKTQSTVWKKICMYVCMTSQFTSYHRWPWSHPWVKETLILVMSWFNTGSEMHSPEKQLYHRTCIVTLLTIHNWANKIQIFVWTMLVFANQVTYVCLRTCTVIMYYEYETTSILCSYVVNYSVCL